MKKLHIDFETRSACDLKMKGAYAYAEHHTTSILCFAFAFDDQPVHIVGREMPNRVREHILARRTVIAHNAQFEYAIWNHHAVKRLGWPKLEPAQMDCTMVRAYAIGLPGSLERAAAAAGISKQKDMEGHRLMLKMSQPREVDPLSWWDDPRDLKRLMDYCMQDVEVERELDKRLPPLSRAERQVWIADQAINERGVMTDSLNVHMALQVARLADKRSQTEIKDITHGEVGGTNCIAQIRDFLTVRGVETDSLDKESVAELLKRELDPTVRRVIEIRAEASGSSVKKLETMSHSSNDGRLRGLFQYHGAHTGRWSGRRVQPHNLPRETLSPDEVGEVMEVLKAPTREATDTISLLHGNPATVLSKCLRGFFVAAPGKKLMGADSSAIESRVLAWLAGDEKTLGVYRGDGKIYERDAADIYGCHYSEIGKDDPRRQLGKVANLALGYQGGVGALQSMASNSRVKLAPACDRLWSRCDSDTREFVRKRWEDDGKGSGIEKREWVASEITKIFWRRSHPEIVAYWAQLEADAIAATEGRPTGGWAVNGSFLRFTLPSGRALTYPYPQVEVAQDKWGRRKKRLKYKADSNNKFEYETVYGGLLAENITQATARDVLAGAILACEAQGMPVVLHVHDEIVVEVPPEIPLYQLTGILATTPIWAPRLPVAAEGWEGRRYRK